MTCAIAGYGCTAPIPALQYSFRLSLNAQNVITNNGGGLGYVQETMPIQRNHGTAVMLPNGKVLLVSGMEVSPSATSAHWCTTGKHTQQAQRSRSYCHWASAAAAACRNLTDWALLCACVHSLARRPVRSTAMPRLV